MPVLTSAQTAALRRALGALNNILPSLELIKALGEVSEYWMQTAQQLYQRYAHLCRLAETALAFDAGADQPVNHGPPELIRPGPPGFAGQPVPVGNPCPFPGIPLCRGMPQWTEQAEQWARHNDMVSVREWWRRVAPDVRAQMSTTATEMWGNSWQSSGPAPEGVGPGFAMPGRR